MVLPLKEEKEDEEDDPTAPVSDDIVETALMCADPEASLEDIECLATAFPRGLLIVAGKDYHLTGALPIHLILERYDGDMWPSRQETAKPFRMDILELLATLCPESLEKREVRGWNCWEIAINNEALPEEAILFLAGRYGLYQVVELEELVDVLETVNQAMGRHRNSPPNLYNKRPQLRSEEHWRRVQARNVSVMYNLLRRNPILWSEETTKKQSTNVEVGKRKSLT